jgi:hypothetical protein
MAYGALQHLEMTLRAIDDELRWGQDHLASYHQDPTIMEYWAAQENLVRARKIIRELLHKEEGDEK